MVIGKRETLFISYSIDCFNNLRSLELGNLVFKTHFMG